MADERVGQNVPDLSTLVRDFGDAEAEYRAAREEAALFDFSFMARARLSGPGAAAAIEAFQTRPVSRLAEGRIAYSLRLDADDYVRTDLTTWRLGRETWEVFSGDARDVAALRAQAEADVEIEDLSDDTAIFAVQGPCAPRIMKRLCGDALDDIEYFAFRPVSIEGIECTAGRLGYTGEKGVELVTDRRHADDLWRHLAALARPGGFVAIDRLRIEAGFLLFANECCLPATPAELGMARFAVDGGDGAQIRLVAFEGGASLPAEPWRPGADLRLPGEGEIVVTSACRARAGGVIGLGFVPADEAEAERAARDNAGVFGTVTQVEMPVYDPDKQRPRGPWR